MEDLGLPDHYRRKIKQLIFEYNRSFPLPYYFHEFLKGKSEVNIADLGSGPVCTLGNIWGNVKINIYASDIRGDTYTELVNQQGVQLITPIEKQNMEELTYSANFFDVVHCVNALDHTKDAKKALEEMKRVCKVNGFVYLRHTRDQLNANGSRGHYWNARPDGFRNEDSIITLEGFSTTFDGLYVISVWRKKE